METTPCLRTLQKKRTSNFREDETKLLIQLWGSPQVQNKLYLTHRKAPVMRLLAANMQRHGFYRTPDEIKTRIRNLKCLYHRIKRTMQNGTGIGTVDPDWPHYKSMDHILSKEGSVKKDNLYKDNIFEGPRCEDIKQEIEDIDINDDMESFTTNSNHDGSEFGEESNHLPTLIPAPPKPETQKQVTTQPQIKNVSTILPNLTNFAIPFQTGQNTSGLGTMRPGTMPFPLLIVQSQQKPTVQQTMDNNAKKTQPTLTPKMPSLTAFPQKSTEDGAVATVLKELLSVQKENLAIEKQKLELEKQKLEFQRLIGSQLLTLVPVFGGLIHRLAFPNVDETSTGTSPTKNGRKRTSSSQGSLDILKDSKILRTVLERGIKKYMMGEEYQDEEEEDDNDEDSENEDSGILMQNDEASNSSK